MSVFSFTKARQERALAVMAERGHPALELGSYSDHATLKSYLESLTSFKFPLKACKTNNNNKIEQRHRNTYHALIFHSLNPEEMF